MIKQLSDYALKFTGKAPDEDSLRENVATLQRQHENAINGIFDSPMYQRSNFDVNSERRKIYIETLQKHLDDARSRLEFLYPTGPQDMLDTFTP